MHTVVNVIYLVSAILFIFGLKMLTRVQTARRGNMLSSSAMFLAVLATLIDMGSVDYTFIIAGVVLGAAIGAVMAIKVEMTSMPEMVALLNGFGGGASALVALSVLFSPDPAGAAGVAEAASSGSLDLSQGYIAMVGGPDTGVTLLLSVLIGSLTLTGSLIAFGKLKGLVSGQPILFPGNQILNILLAASIIGLGVFLMAAAEGQPIYYACIGLAAAAAILGVLLVTPIGGADMPVVISLLNSYSGLAAAMAGFVLMNNVLIISGALVGASGLILTQIMCKAMNRSLVNVLFGGFGQEGAASGGGDVSEVYTNVKSCGAEEAAMLFESARDVIIVPGYGLAVAQAQHVTKELADLLAKNGARVRYAIHPVAGRMPGHMNVLLAESNVPHEQLFDLDQINDDFRNADIALVLGANDVVNPAAGDDPQSPIHGMPVLRVWDAKTSIVVKRSLGSGFAAIPNHLFNNDNNLMLFGDAKKMLTELNHELKDQMS